MTGLATTSRVVPILAVLCILVAGGAAYMLRPEPAAVPAALSLQPHPPQVEPAPDAPRFDVVRVGPQRTAVIAGRAEPGAEVTLRDSGIALGTARADAHGAWVMTPAAPLAPGGRELTLAARGAGGTEVPGDAAVLLQIPDSPAAPAPPALLLPSAAPPRLLQGPATPAGRLTLDTVDYDDAGSIRFTGNAPAGTPLRVYVDDAPVGDAAANESGRWTLVPLGPVTAGVHRLRVDQLAPTGRVLARVELPFQRAAVPQAEAVRVVVQPGQTLWRLARQAYGSGVRYTAIYLANQEQIRDPRLIYPGQAFAVPGGR